MKIRGAATDTHPLVFYAAASKKLSRDAKAHFEATEAGEVTTYVPAVVLWEISLLMRGGKIDLGRSVRRFAADLFSIPTFQFVDLSDEQLFLADERRPNNDPFDSLICAVAHDLSVPLITRDVDIGDSGLVKVLW